MQPKNITPASKLSVLFEQQPVISVLLLGIGVLFFQYLPRFLAPDLAPFTQKFIGKVIIAILAIALISLSGWWRETGFLTPLRLANVKIYLPLLILPAILAILSDFNVSDPAEIALISLSVFIVGFAEESIVRGLFMRIAKPLGLVRAVWFSSIVFGLLHFGNLLMGVNFGSTLTQVIYATLIGLAFAGAFAAGKSIWPLIIIHALINLISGLDGSTEVKSTFNLVNALIMVGIQVPFALYGLWLLNRQVKSGGPVQA